MYYILEIQRSADGTCSHIVQTAETRNEAESKYHGILQYAALSNLPMHSAIIIEEDGTPVMHQYYTYDFPPVEQGEESGGSG